SVSSSIRASAPVTAGVAAVHARWIREGSSNPSRNTVSGASGCTARGCEAPHAIASDAANGRQRIAGLRLQRAAMIGIEREGLTAEQVVRRGRRHRAPHTTHHVAKLARGQRAHGFAAELELVLEVGLLHLDRPFLVRVSATSRTTTF